MALGAKVWISSVVLAATALSQERDGAVIPCFTAADSGTFIQKLATGRPRPVTPAHRGRLLSLLPKDGRVLDLTPDEQAKLDLLHPVLAVHERETVYRTIVVDIPQAFIGLIDRSAILISRPALGLLSGPELQAQVAHEAGHEYVWPQYEAAMEQKNGDRIQALELFCDGIGLATLHVAGIDPRLLLSGLKKTLRFNERFGTPTNEKAYPTIRQRERFHASLLSWLAGKGTKNEPSECAVKLPGELFTVR